MSNLAQRKIYKPQALSFEIQQFRQAMVCWISGVYHTSRLQLATKLPLEFFPKQILLRQVFTKTMFSFYGTHSTSHAQKLHQQRSLFYVFLQHWLVGNVVGFQNALRVRGVGYKFEVSPLKITIQVGYSHLLTHPLPSTSIFQRLAVNKKWLKLSLQGVNLTSLNLYLATIRNLRRPDVYKGKGLRYQKDRVVRKEGKKKKN